MTELAALPAVAEVVVDLHAPDVDRVFHYLVPARMRSAIRLGHRVVVPFGRRPRVEGYVVGFVSDSPREELKEVAALLDPEPLLDEASIRVARWMRARYLCPLVQALQAFLPPGSRIRGKSPVRALTERRYRAAPEAGAEDAARLSKGAPAQARLLSLLLERGEALTFAEVKRAIGTSRAPLSALVEKGLVIEAEVARPRRPLSDTAGRREPHALTPEQRRAVDEVSRAVAASAGGELLLHGVTGSGKTEVYLQAIAAVVASGRGAILLVPEIALTAQTVQSFHEFFGPDVAVLHSRLSAGERYDEWQRVRRGEAPIVVGARSAVFAPVRRLGLIILDEEHEPSYKQEESPRYHAREVARRRAIEEGAVLLLGSATPAMETRRRAERGEAIYLRMEQRIDGRPLPAVDLVDMREELAAGNRRMISRRLLDALDRALSRGEQAVLFINRRGMASFLLCRECGHVPRCGNCEVSLTLHQAAGEGAGTLRCHYCDGRAPHPSRCPECGGPYLRPFGGGTQRVEKELEEILPGVRAIRMDVDTTGRKGAHERILKAFGSGRYDVLVGTQMVAKGLHFPGVTVVGALAADMGLHFPDYRSAERTFQLLTQVAGRAGRGSREGRVIVQTYVPDHYAVQAAARHDYDGFYASELDYRRRAGYPPFAGLVRLIWSGEDETETVRAAQETVVEALGEERSEGGVELIGPCPAPLARLKGRYRWHALLRGDLESVQESAMRVKNLYDARGSASVRLAIDVDPMSLL